jgi:hypothetical protein
MDEIKRWCGSRWAAYCATFTRAQLPALGIGLYEKPPYSVLAGARVHFDELGLVNLEVEDDAALAGPSSRERRRGPTRTRCSQRRW